MTNITVNFRLAKIVLAVILLVLFGTFIAIDTNGSRNRLQSLAGITILLAIGFIFSKHQSKVPTRRGCQVK